VAAGGLVIVGPEADAQAVITPGSR